MLASDQSFHVGVVSLIYSFQLLSNQNFLCLKLSPISSWYAETIKVGFIYV